MSSPNHDALPYPQRVREALKVRCVHLKTKEAFLGLPSHDTQEGRYDTTIWWCAQTCLVFGPDGGTAAPAGCERPGRACYTPPVRPEPAV